MADTDHDRLVILEESVKGMKENLLLQAHEYERRLTDLNHAHAKAIEERALTISTDKFDGYTDKVEAWQTSVNQTLAELKGRSAGGSAAGALVFQVLPILFAVAALAMALWKNAP